MRKRNYFPSERRKERRRLATARHVYACIRWSQIGTNKVDMHNQHTMSSATEMFKDFQNYFPKIVSICTKTS